MSIPAAVSLEAVQKDLAAAVPFAAAAGLILDTAALCVNNLRFYVIFQNCRADKFYAEFDCCDYPLLPPTIEFTDEARQIRGLKHLYPNVFHSAPCVCMRYNRKAYGDLGGPHADWRLIDWHLPTPGGGPITSLALMISDMHTKILASSGRIGG